MVITTNKQTASPGFCKALAGENTQQGQAERAVPEYIIPLHFAVHPIKQKLYAFGAVVQVYGFYWHSPAL